VVSCAKDTRRSGAKTAEESTSPCPGFATPASRHTYHRPPAAYSSVITATATREKACWQSLGRQTWSYRDNQQRLVGRSLRVDLSCDRRRAMSFSFGVPIVVVSTSTCDVKRRKKGRNKPNPYWVIILRPLFVVSMM
jgi:hypothetical protein